ncbi:MAG TPA: hypothetical protein VFS42_00700, partial [Burkholderiaceae bacterium]|nr:hypothetical protein [Burkholderiaceae bacterium]
MQHALASTALLAAVLMPAHANEISRFYGYAYDLETGRYLYTEVHRVKLENGRWRSGTTGYFAPDGKVIATRSFDFADNPFVPVYTFAIPEQGYLEGISNVSSAGIAMFNQSR